MPLTISRLQRLAGITESTELSEGMADYKRMFQSITQSPELSKIVSGQDIAEIIRRVKSVYTREDRIIWALRNEKMALLWSLSDKRGVDNNTKTQLYNDIKAGIANMAKRGGVSTTDIHIGVSYTQDGTADETFAHYLSLPIPEIQNTEFKWQSFNQLRDHLSDLERSWGEQQKSIIPPQDHHDVVMDFGDGWAWVNLNQSYCKEEGSAMEHCGNVDGQERPDDRILSLRKQTQDGNVRPSLTFILDPNGLLGEMKGRRNQKPSAKYHQYIIPLLQSDMVKGIKGGGFAPENNFSLVDLSDNITAELVEKKPKLADLQTKYELYGWDDPRFQTDIEQTLVQYGIPMVEGMNKDGNVVFKSFNTISEFVASIKPSNQALLSLTTALTDAKNNSWNNDEDRTGWVRFLRKTLRHNIKYGIPFDITTMKLVFDEYADEVETEKCSVSMTIDNFIEIINVIGIYNTLEDNGYFGDESIMQDAEQAIANGTWFVYGYMNETDLEQNGVDNPKYKSPNAREYWKAKEMDDTDKLHERRNMRNDIAYIKRLAGI